MNYMSAGAATAFREGFRAGRPRPSGPGDARGGLFPTLFGLAATDLFGGGF